MGEDRTRSEGEQTSVTVPKNSKPRVEQWRGRLALIGQIIAGIGVLGAVISGLVSTINTWSFWNKPNSTMTAQMTGAQELRATSDRQAAHSAQSDQQLVPPLSLVVVPFENESVDQSQQWFVDSITRDVTTGLSQVEGSFVIAWASAVKLRQQNLTPQQIGTDLSVRYLVTGAVRRSDTHVSITASLVNTQTSRELWSQRFEADGNDISSIRDEIASKIAFATRTRLLQVE